MLCCICGLPATRVCHSCSQSLRPGGQRQVGGALVLSAYAHRGAAAALVQHLKYRRNLIAADVLADAMAALIGWEPECLVPVPRSVHRRMQYGIDQTGELARRIGWGIGVPVHPVLAAPLWRDRHAGRGRSDRKAARFRTKADVPEGAVLIDDVVTTGRTIHEALDALDDPRIRVVTATSAGTMSGGADAFQTLGGGVAHERTRIARWPAAVPSNPAPDHDRGTAALPRLDLRPREEHG